MHWIALQPLPDATGPDGDAAGLQGDDDAAALIDALAALGWWALQFTPRVAQVDGAVLMEVSASERLFGGRKPLLDKIYKENKPVALVHYAQAATSLIAIARLQLSQSASRKPDDLPLTTLLAARPHLPTLTRIGCATWGQLRALPRGGLVRRFGAGLVDALDRAYGAKPELYPWLELPAVFEARLELTARIDNAPALMFGARRLLAQLHVWLQARQRGILALELGWELDARRQDAPRGQLTVRTAEPTLDMAHVQRLLAENLARVTLHAPALYLHMRSLETAALPGTTTSLLPDDVRVGDSLHHLLERLSARLGADHVLRAVPYADHRPERMQVWQAASPAASVFATNSIAAHAYPVRAGSQKDTSKQPKTDARSDELYPTWLLTQPLKLPVRNNTPQCADEGGPLTLLAGPQRVEAGWWGVSEKDGACALRDYFLARSEQMGLLWIYQERLPGQGAAGGRTATGPDWYLHGVFA
ncbi:MAG: DNA polymerase Y family protein [Rhodoferax sp.]|nr:DNA polymerase Y family protein [Rhodoferax sp.]